MEVYEALTAADGSLSKARRAVSMIVGRDTENLDREGVIRAAVETVAENTADGVIAPLFYLALGGAVGGMAYKAINTMDSMLGYKNDRYQYFGTAAARLDDAAGFIPARLSGILLVAAAGLTGMDAANAWRIFCRDRYAHKSPNSAQSESAVAGLRGAGCAQAFHRRPAKGDRSGGHSQSEQAYVRGVRAGTRTGGRSACGDIPFVLSLYWRKIRQ